MQAYPCPVSCDKPYGAPERGMELRDHVAEALTAKLFEENLTSMQMEAIIRDAFAAADIFCLIRGE